MKATPENKVKAQLIKVLNELGCYHYPASAGAYSIGGIPDRVGCYKGQFFGCECKAPGKKSTALQVQQKQKIEAAGGAWFLIDGPESIENFKNWCGGCE